MENKRIFGLLCCLNRQLCRENHNLFVENGISHVQMHALTFIRVQTISGMRVCQKDIERQVNLGASAMSTMLGNLEKRGFIKRTVSDGDARTKYVTLTEKGNEVCVKSKQYMDKCDELIQSALTEEEQNIFKALLLKIKAEIDSPEREANKRYD